MEPSAATVWAALLLASHLSGLSIEPQAQLPRVELADQVAGQALGNARPARFAGVTDGNGAVVRLYRGWRGTPADICLLAHELTHVLQVRHHWPEGCALRESPAYRVQAICLTMAGDVAAAKYFTEQARRPACFG